MILLDTNVASEPMKPMPDARVLAWLDAQRIETLYMPSPGLAEVLTGIELVPHGKKRQQMEQMRVRFENELIGPRLLLFDRSAAVRHAELMAMTRRKGVTMTFADCQIAAIASVHGMTVATRDVEPFLAADLKVINPWEL